MKKLIAITDYAVDDLAKEEVKIAIEGFLSSNKASIDFVHSQPSTIHTGFLLMQLVNTIERYSHPEETIFFVNTDPRIQTKKGVEKAEGAKGLILKLHSGIYVIGPNAGYCFSFIKDKVQIAYYYSALDKGSQFRSRDNYARVLAHFMEYKDSELEMEEIDKNEIPDFKDMVVGHIDNYGNIKTTITHEYMKGKYEYGDEVEVKINGVKRKAIYTHNLFGREPGVLVIYPGSSGKPDNPFLELAVRLTFAQKDFANANKIFHYPKPGAKIELSK